MSKHILLGGLNYDLPVTPGPRFTHYMHVGARYTTEYYFCNSSHPIIFTFEAHDLNSIYVIKVV